jgi:CrcB protein
VARYLVSGWAQQAANSRLPVGTFAVNALGCFAVGALMGLVEERGLLSPEARWLLVVGFFGSFTTFSAFGYETLALARGGDWVAAGGNAAAHLVLGLAAVWLGAVAIRLLAP